MSKTCSCSLAITGTFEAVAEVCMALSEELDVSVCYAPTAAFNKKVIDERSVIARSDLHVWDVSGAGSFISAPVRFPNNFKETWNSPRDTVAMDSLEAAGIEELSPAAPGKTGRWKFLAVFTTGSTPPLAMILAMSDRFPDVVVSVVFEEPDAFLWGAQAFRAGEPVLSLVADDVDKFVDFAFTTTATDPVDYYLALDSARTSYAETLLDTAAEESLAMMSPRPNDERMPQLRGWPRWGLFTHAAYDGGLRGLERAMTSSELTPQELAADLIYEASAARIMGIASWVDTVMFGRRFDQQSTPCKPSAPHSYLHGAGYVSNHRALLDLLAEAGPAAPNASALLASLASPSVRLMTGYHPVAFLAAAVGKSTLDCGVVGDVREKHVRGLNAVLFRMTKSIKEIKDAFNLNVPLVTRNVMVPAPEAPLSGQAMNPGYHFDVSQDKLLGSLLAVALEAPERAESLAPALNAGVPPGFLFRSAAWHGIYTKRMSERTESNPARVVSSMLASFSELYGTYKDFPHDLADEMSKLSPSLLPIYESVLNEEMMREAIRDAVLSTESTASTAASIPTTPARRRTAGA